jgi:hypothetical protein
MAKFMRGGKTKRRHWRKWMAEVRAGRVAVRVGPAWTFSRGPRRELLTLDIRRPQPEVAR